MQINHPGRQTMAALGQPGWSPSEVAVDLGKHSKLIAKPKALNEPKSDRLFSALRTPPGKPKRRDLPACRFTRPTAISINQFHPH